jgi:putative transposase
MQMARKGQGIGIVEGLQGGFGGEDFLRELVQRTVQQVLEAEMSSFLGAGSYERTGERRGWRNGYKPRTLKTRVGELELMVPKDRDGEFQTELFERYQRSEKALVLAMLEMYVEGVSTRKVSAITEALCGLEVSKSQVSALTQKLDAEIAQWRTRPLTQPYPYLVVDARYEKVRQGGAYCLRHTDMRPRSSDKGGTLLDDPVLMVSSSESGFSIDLCQSRTFRRS